jgi:precorrin-8X/cobalt-precorrin-8 methylmutase
MPDRTSANPAGDEITRRSFAIIRERMGPLAIPDDEREIVVRVAHATGDIAFARTVVFSPGAVRAGVEALRAGCRVVVDVGMVRAGIRTRLLDVFGSRCLCLLDDPATAELAAREAITKSAAGMQLAAGSLNGAIAVVGNAPTALFALAAMIRDSTVRPALVVGVPVGFVGALESKTELSRMDVPHITNLSERGGSPIAAAIVNGLIVLAAAGARRE